MKQTKKQRVEFNARQLLKQLELGRFKLVATFLDCDDDRAYSALLAFQRYNQAHPEQTSFVIVLPERSNGR